MKQALFTVALAGFLTLLATYIIAPTHTTDVRKSTYTRVMNSGKLRCGYIPYPPELIVDPATGALSGYLYDIINKIGEEASIEIEWTEEVGIANAFEGLYTNRYDAVCAGFFENPSRATRVIFSQPLNYTASYVYAREGDTRFDNDFSIANSPNITIAVVDGEISEFIAREKFPNAKIFALPQTANNPTQAMVAVTTGKADIALSQKATAKAFMKHNPGTMHLVSEKPAQAYSQTLASFHPEDYALKAFFDTSIRSLYAAGVIEEILSRYDPEHDTYLLLDTPYR
jgi:polar amino acid transport system substrate-binding protein